METQGRRTNFDENKITDEEGAALVEFDTLLMVANVNYKPSF
jgi:hypothetical protein